MSSVDRLDPAVARTIRTVLGRRAPRLLAALDETDTPVMAVREQVLDVLSDEFSREGLQPDYEPNSYGVEVDDALGWFLKAFPITEPTRGTDRWPPNPDLRGREQAES